MVHFQSQVNWITGASSGIGEALVKAYDTHCAPKKFEAYIGGTKVKGIYLKRFFSKLLHKVVLRSNVV